MNLYQAIDAYLLVCQTEGRAPRTLRRYRKGLRAFVHSIEEAIAIQRNTENLRMFMADLALRARSGVAKKFLHWMYMQKFVSETYSQPPHRLARRL